jgi:hypothetical protein
MTTSSLLVPPWAWAAKPAKPAQPARPIEAVSASRKRLCRAALFMALCVGASAASALTATVDVSGTASDDVENAASNVRKTLTLTPGAHVTAVGWDVSLTATSPSWLTELTVSLLDSTGAVGVNLTPGYGDNRAGTASYSTGGTVDLLSLGQDFYVGNDGLLKLQFFESYNDVAGADGMWNSGTISLEYQTAAVPEAGTAALMSAGALGLLTVTSRRRRD